MKKIIAPILLMLVIAVLGAIGYLTYNNFTEQQQIQQQQQLVESQKIALSGLIGSEKSAFFNDPQVQKILLEDYKITLDVQKVGSRSIAVSGGAKGAVDQYDFAFPAGLPAATKIEQSYPIKQKYHVFFTPMAVASWQPVVDVLQNNNIVSMVDGHYVISDMNKLMQLMTTQTRWKDLPNNTGFDIGRQILIKSTDIRKSNSAAMYLALSSYMLNNEQIVNDKQQADDVVKQALPLFASQGFLAGSSATPFQDYLIKGMGNSPLVMIYESQFLYQATQAKGAIKDNMVLLYPEPTIFTQHVFIAMSEQGKVLGEALTTNPQLQELAIKHGFRSNDANFLQAFTDNLQQHDIQNVPEQINDVIDPPSYDLIEDMIVSIEQGMQ